MPPAVFVFGHTATGKTLVVTRMLENLQYIYAVVNCVECYMPQLLFEPILNKIHGNYHYLCNCSIIYSFTNYNLFTSIYSTFTDSEAALLYHISEIKSCLSWGRRKKSHVLRWLSLLPFCLLLYFSPLLRACFTQSGIYVINTIYFPMNIGTRWLEKGMGKHDVCGRFMGFLSLIPRKLNLYKMQRNGWLEHLYRCFQQNLEEMAWPLIFVGLGTFKSSGSLDTWYSYESWNAECHSSQKCWGGGDGIWKTGKGAG